MPESSISEPLNTISDPVVPAHVQDKENTRRKRAKNPKQRNEQDGSGKLRGLPTDTPDTRLSKTLSWLLRHGAHKERLPIRPDGFVKVADLINTPKVKHLGLDLARLQEIVKVDPKERFALLMEPSAVPGEEGVWWVKANQGHSIKALQVDLKPILTVKDIPTGVAVHGTKFGTWPSIAQQGLSKMTRNHIHLAQGVPGDKVISGMRQYSQVLIYINVQKALEAGIKFYLSDNGVVLTEGDEKGFLKPEFFERVENSQGQPMSITGEYAKLD